MPRPEELENDSRPNPEREPSGCLVEEVGTFTVLNRSIEARWLRSVASQGETLVFLHEGLGSITTWGSFPAQVCASASRTGLVYSRSGHGHSAPTRSGPEFDFLEHEAYEVLPALLAQAVVPGKPVLYGHSDGATIALMYASIYPVAGLILEAPHVFLEPETMVGIDLADAAWQAGRLRLRLSRHHADPAGLFASWRDTWRQLNSANWEIETLIPKVQCPVLVVQGEKDSYGTLAQVRKIAENVSGQVSTFVLPACGHIPHREMTQQVVKLVGEFLTNLSRG